MGRKKIFPNFSLRFDKNQHFSPRLTPRFSMVYSVDDSNLKFIRMSAQTAFRFPSVVDQWTNLFVAPVYVVGGQSELQDVYNLQGSNIYPLDGNNPVLSKPILTDVIINIHNTLHYSIAPNNTSKNIYNYCFYFRIF